MRRIELYERYVRTLLEHWERNRSEGARRIAEERLEPEGMQWHLTELAWWLHQHRPSGTARGEDLVRALAEQLLRREGELPSRAPADRWARAEARAALVLQEVKDIAGLLGERGRDAHGFLHLTFQEYFVGRALACVSAPERWERLRPHLHDPRWKEPLVWCAAWLGVLEPQGAGLEDLVRRIRGAHSEHEPVLHRDLFLAATVGAEDVPRCEPILGELLAPLEDLQHSPIPPIRRQALEALLHLLRRGSPAAGEHISVQWVDQDHLEDFLWILPRDLGTPLPARLRDALLARLADVQVRPHIIPRLEAFASGDARVLEALLALREEDDPFIRHQVLSVLATVADGDARVLHFLLSQLEAKDLETQEEMPGILSPLVERHPQVREALLALLDHEDPLVVSKAIAAVSPFAGLEPRVREALQSQLGSEGFAARCRDSPRLQLREAIVQALSPLVDQDSRGSDALLSHNDPAPSGRSNAVSRALEPRTGHDPRVREALFSQLEDEDPKIREAAVKTLGATVEHDAQARRALLARLEDTSSQVRRQATQILSVLMRRDEEVRHALLVRLKETRVENLWFFGWALGDEVVDHDEEVRHALLPALDVEHEVDRQYALGMLRGAAGRDERVRDAFLTRLGVEKSEEVRRRLVEMLGALASHDDKSRHALRRRLDGEEDLRLRERIAQTLGPRMGWDETVRETLLRWLRDGSVDVRRAAALAVGSWGGRDEQVRDALLARLEHEEERTRHAFLEALALAGWGDAVLPLLLSSLETRDSLHPSTRERLYPGLSWKGVIQALMALEPRAALRQTLLARLEDENARSRRVAAWMLEGFADQDAGVRLALVARLEDEDFEVRAAAAQALSAVREPEPGVCHALLALFEDRHHSGEREAAVRALRSAAVIHEGTRHALLRQLEDSWYARRECAAEALKPAVERHEDVRRASLARLDDTCFSVRRAAVEALGPLTPRDAEVRHALLTQLRACTRPWDAREPEDLHCALLHALGAAAARDLEVREALLSRLEEDEWVLRATALQVLLTHVPEVLEPERWLPWLGVSYPPRAPAGHESARHFIQVRLVREVREVVVQRAATLSIEDESRVDQLARLLREPRWSVREGAALALLSRPGGPPPRVLPALRGLLTDFRDEDASAGTLQVAALLLKSRDRETSRAALDRVLRTLDEGTQPWFDGEITGPVRAQAAELLGQLQPLYREERVLQRLLRVMLEDARQEARESAYHAVLGLLAAPPEPARRPPLAHA